MRNLCSRGKELTEAVNSESVRLTRSSKSLDTRPLKAFIITSICSFIACIFATTGDGVISVRDERLTFCRSNLLGALLPSGPSRSHRSTLVPYWSFSWIPHPTFRHNCSSKTSFFLVRRSTAAVRVYTCLLRVVGHSLSSWTLLVVSIDRVSTMQLFVREAFTYKAVSHRWCQLMMPKKSPVSHRIPTHSKQYLHNKKGRPNRKHRCGAGQIPSEGQVRTLTTLEC